MGINMLPDRITYVEGVLWGYPPKVISAWWAAFEAAKLIIQMRASWRLVSRPAPPSHLPINLTCSTPPRTSVPGGVVLLETCYLFSNRQISRPTR